MNLSKLAGMFVAVVGLVMMGCQKAPPPPPKETVVTYPPVADSVWLDFRRRRPDLYRQDLQTAPPMVLVRESRYAFNPTNGMRMHYGWLDGRLADLHVNFQELVSYAYGGDYSRTEFPDAWKQGHLTNVFDVIATVTNRAQDLLQTEARKFLREQYGLAWHPATKATDVLVIRAKDPHLLQSKVTKDFSHSKSIGELAGELSNYFSCPVIDQTGMSNRIDKTVENVPSRWVNGRTTNLDANNYFLEAYGLELVATNLPQEWLVMDKVK